jgi:uncharacterized protein
MDKETIEKVLRIWNPHFENIDKSYGQSTIPRTLYLSKLQELIHLRHILVLTGIRRAGKTTLMHQLMRWLMKKEKVPPKNILYLFLEDILITPYLQHGAKFLDALLQHYQESLNPQGKIYLFLDEIQGIPDFNRWIASQYERNPHFKFILSGSCQSLVKASTASLLTGRNIQIDIYPFSFSEYLGFNKVPFQAAETPQEIWQSNFSQSSQIQHYLSRYMLEGGFPEIVLASNETEKRAIASSYYHDCVHRDILLVHSIRNARDIELLGLHLFREFTKTHSYSSLGKPFKLSVDTIKNYLSYYQQAHLFFESPFFSYKSKESQDIQKARKIYTIDSGLRNWNIPQIRPDFGQCAENLCFLELKKTCQSVYYWKGKQEVDFAVFSPTLHLINVSFTDKIPPREYSGLREAMESLQLDESTLITKNTLQHTTQQGKTIHQIPLWAWLLATNKSPSPK